MTEQLKLCPFCSSNLSIDECYQLAEKIRVLTRCLRLVVDDETLPDKYILIGIIESLLKEHLPKEKEE